MRRTRVWMIAVRLARLLLLASFVTGCDALPGPAGHPSAQELLARLPTEVGSSTLENRVVFDDTAPTDSPIDAVLAALRRDRSDVSAAFASGPGDVWTGALAIRNIDGETLLRAVVEVWQAEEVTTRTPEVIGGRPAWLLALRSGMSVAWLRAGDIAYFAVAMDPRTLEEAVRALPG